MMKSLPNSRDRFARCTESCKERLPAPVVALDLPDLGAIERTLAADNARVLGFINGLATRVDRMVLASQEGDWSQLRNECANLKSASDAYGRPELGLSAQRVHQATATPENEFGIRRALMRLVTECGVASCPTAMA